MTALVNDSIAAAPPDSASAFDDPRVVRAVQEYLAQAEAGGKPSRTEFVARYPDIAEPLDRCLAGLEFVQAAAPHLSQPLDGVAPTDGAGAVTGTLGDFRILREVGRGGMGVVYEAEQVSLGRRVALKVLPYAATMDPRHLQRFQNEARAAASLHHEHIVPVHAVGQERGVHYYAMQFIEGLTLAQFLAHQRGNPPNRSEQPTTDYTPPPDALAAETAVAAADTTVPLPRDLPEFRRIAEWGIQAALALEHAHQLGIVHRDIKPGNLMLDGAGKLWVTDFGLARIGPDSGVTLSGDLVGTLRYMSPEQALAKRVVIDHRTDIYSLGVTLYEVVTGQPAVTGQTREEILKRIVFEEPRPPRQLNRALPADLETILLKAVAQEPERRYGTAQELADDLRRWREDQPIRARRASGWERVRKWGRRHRPLVAAAVVVVVLAGAMLGAGLGWQAHELASRRERTEQVVNEALKESTAWQERGRLLEALSAARRAEGLVASGTATEALRQRVRARVADLELLETLENVRLEMAAIKDDHFDYERVDARYAATFRDFGLEVETVPVEEVGERIRGTTVVAGLVSALDHWALTRRHLRGEDDPTWKHLLRVARAADPDAWRTRLREALERRDQEALRVMVASAEVFRLPAATLLVLGVALREDKQGSVQVEALLREVQRRHPDDFWVNFDLASNLNTSKPPRVEEAIRFYSVAVALRPQSPAIHHNLGKALNDKGDLGGAIKAYQEALRLKKDFPEAHINLGAALANKGDLDGAIKEYQEALRLKKDFPQAHHNLGNALLTKGDVDGAIKEYQEALRLKKDYAEAHLNLGAALYDKGDVDGAIKEFQEALRLKKDYPQAHHNLGAALGKKGDLVGAIQEYQEALRLKKDYPQAHHNLGAALDKKGDVDGAIKEYREALRLKKDSPDIHNNLGLALQSKEDLEGAIQQYQEALRLKKDYSQAHINLGNALQDKGDLDGAIKEYQAALSLQDGFPGAHYNLGNALREKGDLDGAIKEYQEALRLKKDFPEAHGNLGNALKAKGDLDGAIKEYQEVLRLSKEDPLAHYLLGNALKAKGEVAEAIQAYQDALRLKKEYPEAHCNLGLALQAQGRFSEALSALKRGHHLGSTRPDWPYPSAQWVQQCQRLVELDTRLQDILGGKAQPADAAERIALAEVCHLKRLYRQAARFYEEAFAEQPNLTGDVRQGHRYNAACAAALAGCGKGKEADQTDDKERSRLRQQALKWLQADVAAYRQMLEKEPDKARPVIAQQMQHWLKDTDFAGVRGREALAKLPAAERQAWQQLWTDVADLLARAKATPALQKKPGGK
jgi:tetratricopeptide (TPR) repeat protein